MKLKYRMGGVVAWFCKAVLMERPSDSMDFHPLLLSRCGAGVVIVMVVTILRFTRLPKTV